MWEKVSDNMNVIKYTEYLDIIKQRDDSIQLILEKANEFAFIIGRSPIGECTETDFEIEDGKFFVQFESRSCGESDYDTYMLPMEFIFDEDYPKKYAKIHKDEQLKKENERLNKEKESNRLKTKQMKKYDRREYARLKKKYENDSEDDINESIIESDNVCGLCKKRLATMGLFKSSGGLLLSIEYKKDIELCKTCHDELVIINRNGINNTMKKT